MAISSIFNDVLGPVMRGPSSSHSAAACRIGLLVHDLMDGDITHVEIDYDPNGSLVTTHESQGTDMGLYGGLLGWEANDERMLHYLEEIERSGIQITINYLHYDAPHPNYYRMRISNDTTTHTLSAISTGGGMIEVVEIDGSTVSMFGDFFELLVFGNEPELVLEAVSEIRSLEVIRHGAFVEMKSGRPFPDGLEQQLEGLRGVTNVRMLRPVLPVLSSADTRVPFATCREMLEKGEREGMELWELALSYECARGGISKEEVMSQMKSILYVMKESVESGLAGTYYEDRILPVQSAGFDEKMKANELIESDLLNTITLYITALMENKSAMGVFVAAPTAGSCGTLPGTLIAAAEVMGMDDDALSRALLAAGMMGVFIAEHATFAAEVAGCQAETGAGGCMAAAGLVVLKGGTLKQAVAAASLALQNSLGIVCDPIGNRVEAPCLGKNVMAGANALTCANMALANYEHLIPFDEVVQAMGEVGDMMAYELTCTGLGGLAATPTGKAIEARLKEKAKYC